MKKRKLLSIVLSLCMVLALMPLMAFAEEGDVDYRYCDENGANWQTGTKKTGEYTLVTEGVTSLGSSGQTTWYVVKSDVTIGVGDYRGQRITVNGDVNLILADGYTLNVRGGIQVSRGNSLTIYGQAGGTGKLIADARATSSYYAGIGGGSGDPNGDITINGGVVNAIGGLNSAGIGIGINASGKGGKITINGGTVDAAADMQADNPAGAAGIGCGGNGGTVVIEINGGTVIATGYLGGAGIGCGNHEGWADITINGGNITATGNNGGAGIGTGQVTGPALITISGGIVTATGNGGGAGIDDGVNDGDGPTTINGNAVIFASSISNQSGKENNTWRGVIFESNSGKVYGTSVAPTDDFTIPADKILTIESGKVLAISQNNVTLTNNGKIYVDGTVSGTVGGDGDVYYNLDLKNCTTDSTCMETHNEKTYAKAGNAITLTPDTPPTGYVFDSWEVSDTTVKIGENNKFTMPAAALTVTAQYKDIEKPVISGVKDGKTYCSAQTVTVSDNDAIEKVTVNEVEVTLDEQNQFTRYPASGVQEIIATDKTGNSTKVTVTINDGHTYGAWKSNGKGTHIRYCTVDGCDGYEDGKCAGGEATCTAKAECEYCGEEYGEIDSSNHSLENIHAKDATVTETGNTEYWQCENCDKYFSDENGENEITLDETVISKLPPEIIKGEGQSITAGEKKALSFTSNAAFSDFIRVELDGKTLDEKNYAVKEGSTIVTLNADYVATLPAGEHTIGIVSESGTAETTFTVAEKAAPGTSDDSDKDSKSDNDSVKTGDDTNLALWLALMLLSGAGITGVTAYTRRKRTNE